MIGVKEPAHTTREMVAHKTVLTDTVQIELEAQFTHATATRALIRS
jgi:hypothetical protein